MLNDTVPAMSFCGVIFHYKRARLFLKVLNLFLLAIIKHPWKFESLTV